MLNVFGIILSCLISVFAQNGIAQDYPVKPVKIVVPFAPGNSSDLVARVIATHLTTALGQQVIVDNRPGAGATIGTEYGAKQPPDGYTLILGSPGGLIINPIMQKLRYNPLTDFSGGFCPGLGSDGDRRTCRLADQGHKNTGWTGERKTAGINVRLQRQVAEPSI